MRYKMPSGLCHCCCTQGAIHSTHQTSPRAKNCVKAQPGSFPFVLILRFLTFIRDVPSMLQKTSDY